MSNSGAHAYIMGALVLAVGLFQVTAASRLSFGGVKPDLVLLLVLMWTLLYGPRSGLVWGFISGIWLDVFSNGPMGATSLGYMLAALFAGLGFQVVSRFNLLVPLITGAVGTLIFALTYLAILEGLGVSSNALNWGLPDYRLPWQETAENVVLPLVLYNTALMLAAIPFLNRVQTGDVVPRFEEE